MSSINISYLREEFPALSDSEAAAEYAKKWEIVMILQYKIHPDGEYTNLGICKSKSEAENYFYSPNCHDVEVIYDGRYANSDTTVIYDQGAIERNIAFEGDGNASMPCCWNCRNFSIPLDGRWYCTNHNTRVNKKDLCKSWLLTPGFNTPIREELVKENDLREQLKSSSNVEVAYYVSGKKFTYSAFDGLSMVEAAYYGDETKVSAFLKEGSVSMLISYTSIMEIVQRPYL